MARSDWEHALRTRGGAEAPAPMFDLSFGGSSQEQPGEIVVKVASHIKTVRGTKNAINYIASHGGKRDLQAYDETGARLENDALKKAVDETWGLTPDSENLSRRGRMAAGTQAFKKMEDKDKYQERQSSHLILSLPVKHDQVTDEQLHRIAQEFLRPLAESGHKGMYAIHRHQENPHIHFVVSYRDQLQERSTLRVNPQQIDKLRQHAAEVSKEQGLDVQATRREARPNTIERVLKGLEPLRTVTSKWKFEGQKFEKKSGISLLERQAPDWYDRWGTEFEARRTGAGIKGRSVPKADLPPLPKRQDEALNKWAAQFDRPEHAKQSFLEMAAENERLAHWNADRRPQIFDNSDLIDRIRPSQRHGYKPLTMHEVKLSPEWKKEARASIEDAKVRTQENVRQQNYHLREVNKKLQGYGQEVKDFLIEKYVLTRVAKRVGIDVDRLTFEHIQRGVGKYPLVEKVDEKNEKPQNGLKTLLSDVRQLWSEWRDEKHEDVSMEMHQSENMQNHNDASVRDENIQERAQQIYQGMERSSHDQNLEVDFVRERTSQGEDLDPNKQ